MSPSIGSSNLYIKGMAWRSGILGLSSSLLTAPISAALHPKLPRPRTVSSTPSVVCRHHAGPVKVAHLFRKGIMEVFETGYPTSTTTTTINKSATRTRLIHMMTPVWKIANSLHMSSSNTKPHPRTVSRHRPRRAALEFGPLPHPHLSTTQRS